MDADLLNLCDREPIHIPGSIQPHGLLLVADVDTLGVVGGAGDIERRLSADWLGRQLGELLAQDLAQPLSQLATSAAGVLAPKRVIAHGEHFDVSLHRSGAYILAELEPAAEAGGSTASVVAALERAAAAFEHVGDLRALCRCAAGEFRKLTEFDRVMVYQFLDDGAGMVLAEDKQDDLPTFLNHHFPGSDIPRQARALYVRNRVRVIADVNYEPRPLRPAAAGLSELDLGNAALRSVSPVHIRYLQNMGIGASASISIVQDGLLWGLIACHHRTPKTLSYDVRAICRVLAGGLARQIRAREEAEDYRERLRLRGSEDAVVGQIADDRPLETALGEIKDHVRRMLSADGFAWVQGRDIGTCGSCPARADLRSLADWVNDRALADVFATRDLSGAFPPAAAYRDIGSGLLAITVSTEVPIILLWFRAEALETVNWAGNPHKGVEHDPSAALTPRSSFESWSETVRGRSPPWTRAQSEAATRLRRILFDARQGRRMRDLNRELTITVSDKEGLIRQKDFLIKEVNHRVQNSLQLVSAFLGLQARSTADPALTAHLAEAQQRLSAVALVHRRLYRDDQVETIDLARYLEELCADMLKTMGDGWRAQIVFDLSPILISADRAVNVGLVLTELIINAQKYAYKGDAGPLVIGLERHRNQFRLIVADHGVGHSRTREGFGTRMITAMTEQLGGLIEHGDNHPGLRVVMTAPIEAENGS